MVEYGSNIVNSLTIDDLDGDSKLLAEIIGIEPLKELIMYAGGDSYYIPSIKKYSKVLLKRYLTSISTDINAVNKSKLIREYGICRKSVEQVITEIRNDKHK